MNSKFVMFGLGGFNLAFTAGLFTEAGLGKSIVAVQRSRDERSESFIRQNGKLHVHIVGSRGGKEIEKTSEVNSISELLILSEHWNKLLELFRGQSLKYVLTNSAERGWDISEADRTPPSERFGMPESHIGRLLVLLRARMEEGLGDLQIIPFELGEENEVRLRGKLEDLLVSWSINSADWRVCGQKVKEYLRWNCKFRGTLVDQMVPRVSAHHPLYVSGEDKLIRIAEPYRLLAIAGAPGDDQFMKHPDVLWCGDQQPYVLRKLCILNGMHTLMAGYWLKHNLPKEMTVSEFLNHKEGMPWLTSALNEEILPAIDGLVPEAKSFAAETMERFSNPALHFPISKIAGNHDTKLRDRLGPTLRLYKQRYNKTPKIINDALSWAMVEL